MKLLLLIATFVLVAAARPGDPAPSRGCIYITGRCYKECEEGTHSYTVGCDFVTPEATCEQPHPVVDMRGRICDYSKCYCDAGTVRDTATDKCVPLEQCSRPEQPQ